MKNTTVNSYISYLGITEDDLLPYELEEVRKEVDMVNSGQYFLDGIKEVIYLRLTEERDNRFLFPNSRYFSIWAYISSKGKNPIELMTSGSGEYEELFEAFKAQLVR